MDFGPIGFFALIAAIVIVPQVLRYKERGRLHDTLRAALERGQPVPPELIAALAAGRRRRDDLFDYPYAASGGPAHVWPANPSGVAGEPPLAEAEAAGGEAAPMPALRPVFVSQKRRDMRRGVLWMAVALGLLAAGGAFYAGLYEVGGAPETFASFAALAAIPFFVGATYMVLAALSQDKARF